VELAGEGVFTGGMVGVLLAFVLSGHGGELTDWMFLPAEDGKELPDNELAVTRPQLLLIRPGSPPERCNGRDVVRGVPIREGSADDQ
jgi:hypothetical protein